MTEENHAKIAETLEIRNRGELTAHGVLGVRGFDEESVTLDTEAGRMTVEGRDLRIESLSKETSSVFIRGEITGVFYSEAPLLKKGFFGRG